MQLDVGSDALKLNITPLCFSVLVLLRTRKVSTLRFETLPVRRSTKTQKHKGVVFEQFERVWA